MKRVNSSKQRNKKKKIDFVKVLETVYSIVASTKKIIEVMEHYGILAAIRDWLEQN